MGPSPRCCARGRGALVPHRVPGLVPSRPSREVQNLCCRGSSSIQRQWESRSVRFADRFLSDSSRRRVFTNEVKMTEHSSVRFRNTPGTAPVGLLNWWTRYLGPGLFHRTPIGRRGHASGGRCRPSGLRGPGPPGTESSQGCPCLGWLHRDTCFVAGKAMRSQRRRQARERQAAEMNALTDHSQTLAQIAPVLDEAIDPWRGRPHGDSPPLREPRLPLVGLALGSNEDTAQKRVSRALDKLSALLEHRGVSLSTAALATALGAGAVTAAPRPRRDDRHFGPCQCRRRKRSHSDFY